MEILKLVLTRNLIIKKMKHNKILTIYKFNKFLLKMNLLTLRYLNSNLESQYQKEVSQQRLQKLTRFMLMKDSFLFVIQIYLLIAYYDYLNVIVLCGSFFMMILNFFIKKKIPSLMFPILMINYLGFVIYYVEVTRNYRINPIGIDNSIVLMIPLQILHSMLIYMKFKWFYVSFFFMFTLIYLFFRVMVIRDEKFFSLVIFHFCASWIMHSYISYEEEKHFKQFYKEMVENYEKANYFKLILNNVIPSPIFIIDYEKSEIKFLNNSGKNVINSKEPPHSNEKSLFHDFEKFLKKFVVIQENPESIECLQKIPNELNALIKIYFNELKKKPFLKISEIGQDVEQCFLRINVSSSEIPDKTKENEFFVQNHNSKCYYEIKITNVYWQDKICLLLLFNDNTNVFRISELLNLDLYKNQLLASISHDLRTPLNGLNGMLELSSSKTNDKEIISYLDLAKKSSCFLNYLINDILDFSLMNYKKMRLNIEEINLENIIQHVFGLIEFQAKEKNLDLKFTNFCQKVVPFFSDSTRIEQILFNLLSNALKFTHKGNIQIILEDFSEDYRRPFYKISVKDTGIGIKTEDLGKLYRLFGRLEDEEKINKTGIGLGLTISKKISFLLCPEKPEGMQVESVYGSGTTFFFYLSTLKHIESSLEEIEALECFDEKKSFHQISLSMPTRFFDDSQTLIDLPNNISKKILVVDDDLMNLMVIEQYLKLFHLSSARAMNGMEAYKIIKKDLINQNQEYSLIIMDCNMPILDGFQASVKIHKYCEKKGKKKIPILAVTANTTAADVLMCKKTGMEYFLEKPIRKSELKKTLEIIFEMKIEESQFKKTS